ncbi:MAG TPA: hypothetical protein VMT46_16480, partial [Anaerolineaceae bacterium]|nr:hypothetical protein [Anaerolineaceae bacterium]
LQDLAGDDQRLDGRRSGGGLAEHPLSREKTAWAILLNSPTNLGTNTSSNSILQNQSFVVY